MADKKKARSNSAPMVKYGTMQNPRTTDANHKARSNSAHAVKFHTMRPTSSCANQKKTCETDRGHELKERDADVAINSSEQLEENEIPPSDNQDNLNQGMKTCKTDKGHELNETDEDVVINSSEQSEENEIPPSDNLDNLNQGMPRSRSCPTNKYNTWAPSRSSEKKQRPTSSCANQKKTCKIDKGHELNETDADVVINSSEQSEENEIPPSDNLDHLNQGMPRSRSFPTNKYNTWGSSRSSEKNKSKADCNCKQGANERNGRKETGAEGCDQPDAAPKTLQSNHAAEVIDEPSVDLVHEITFRSLSEEIGREWETLATYLGVGEKRIEHIKYDNPNNIKQQIYRMLLKWKSMCDDFGSSSFHFLADNLDRVERKPLAAQLRGDFK
ncbi:uncharacterized protein LOC117301541 isoform X2 [Asterias rubens]|uniref:uncharacterized protein LOC117301541 isoform X2 n=1 Tax=Asterias rubens TaxID=7604 RepID=UPI00145533C7|nr:uncharacterized protein LOC117301541 isoform X2 [Asterias rubens]